MAPPWTCDLSRGAFSKWLDRVENGGGNRDRTDDPLLAKQVLSRLSYAPENTHSTLTVADRPCGRRAEIVPIESACDSRLGCPTATTRPRLEDCSPSSPAPDWLRACHAAATVRMLVLSELSRRSGWLRVPGVLVPLLLSPILGPVPASPPEADQRAAVRWSRNSGSGFPPEAPVHHRLFRNRTLHRQGSAGALRLASCAAEIFLLDQAALHRFDAGFPNSHRPRIFPGTPRRLAVHRPRLSMNFPATKPLARLSWGFRGSRTWTYPVFGTEVWVLPPRPFQACLAFRGGREPPSIRPQEKERSSPHFAARLGFGVRRSRGGALSEPVQFFTPTLFLEDSTGRSSRLPVCPIESTFRSCFQRSRPG